MTLETQLLTMITMVLSGLYLGMALETYQRFSKWWSKNKGLSFIFEILFWVSHTCLLFYVLYNVNSGELRIYTFLACALGFTMYKLLFQEAYRYLLEFLIKLINTLVVTPIFWLCKGLYVVVRSLFRAVLYLIKLVITIVVFPLKLLWNIVKKLIPQKVYIKTSQLATFYSTMISNYKKSSR